MSLDNPSTQWHVSHCPVNGLWKGCLCSLPSFLPISLILNLSHLLFLSLGLLHSLLPALTCSRVNQTVVFLPGGMCADKTKALPCTGPNSEKVKVGRSEESAPPGPVKRHNTLIHATHTLDGGVPPLNMTLFYCSKLPCNALNSWTTVQSHVLSWAHLSVGGCLASRHSPVKKSPLFKHDRTVTDRYTMSVQ